MALIWPCEILVRPALSEWGTSTGKGHSRFSRAGGSISTINPSMNSSGAFGAGLVSDEGGHDLVNVDLELEALLDVTQQHISCMPMSFHIRHWAGLSGVGMFESS